MTLPTPSFEDYFQIGLTELLIRRPDLAVFEGDVTDAMLCAIAAAADAATGQAVAGVRRTFFDGATGTDLDRLIDDHTGVPRSGNTFAIGQVSLERPSAAFGAFTYNAGSRMATAPDANGKQAIVALDAPVSFGALELGPKLAAVTATVAGSEGNAAVDTVTTFLDAPDDDTLTVTNPEIITGGEPSEDDDDYRRRGRDFYTTLRRATLAALEFAARTVPQVRSAIAVEDEATGMVTLYVSDADGESNLEMVADVVAAVRAYRAAGITIEVVGGSVLTVNVEYSLVVADGVSAASLEASIATSMQAFGRKQRAGETLYNETLRYAGKYVDPDGIKNIVITSPASDTVPLAYQIIRIGTVTRV